MNDSLTLRHLFLESTKKFAHRPALGPVDGKSRTYEQLRTDAATWVTWLKTLALEPGDRVAILAESLPSWGSVYFGVTAAGFVAVPILPDFVKAQVAHIINHAEVKAAVVSKKLSSVMTEAIEMAESLPNDLPTATMETGEILLGPGKRTVLAEPIDPESYFENDVAPTDIAALLYTSGTTGTSKGVTLSHRAIAWNAIVSMEGGLGPNPKDVRHLSVLPLAHTYECTIGLVGMIAVGGEVRYLNGPPTPTRLLAALEKVKPSIMLTVPLLMEKIYRARIAGPLKAKALGKILYGFPLTRKLIHRVAGKKVMNLFGGNIRFFGIGGAPLPADMERFLVESKFPYSVGYGLTETAPLLAGGDPRDMRYRSTGKVVPGVSIRIQEPNEKGIGEIQAKGPNVMEGYWKDEEKTSEVFTEDGWFKTGDLGTLDGDILYIKGRKKDVILGSNGENIYPEEVESVINSHNFVSESLAVIKDGQLVARIILDAEKLAAEIKRLGYMNAEKITTFKDELMENIRREANKHLSRNARIAAFVEQLRPFEKTPSLKIKRYLYT